MCFCNWSAYKCPDTLANPSLVYDDPLHIPTNLKRVCYEVSICSGNRHLLRDEAMH